MIHWLVPIKDNSERLSGKSLRTLGGKSLVKWTVREALKSDTGSVTIVTDGPSSASVAKVVAMHEPDVQTIEQPDIAGGLMPVIAWAIGELGLAVDDETGIGILLATSPFRSAATIRECVELWQRDRSASVCTVQQICNSSMRYEDAKGWLQLVVPPGSWTDAARERWSDVPAMYLSTGGVQITSTASFRAFGRFWQPKTRKVVLDAIEGLDIDTPSEWRVAEALAGRT